MNVCDMLAKINLLGDITKSIRHLEDLKDDNLKFVLNTLKKAEDDLSGEIKEYLETFGYTIKLANTINHNYTSWVTWSIEKIFE